MNKLKRRISCLMLPVLLMVAGTVNAHANGADSLNVQDVTKTLNIIIHGDHFFEEKNELPCDDSLYCITGDLVLVAALVCNKSGVEGKGDYSAYWKGDGSGNGKTRDRYTWVFVPENFLKVCQKKGLFDNPLIPDSDRLCKLLGLGTEVQRDTIVYMKVPKDSLFRPAYVTNVDEIISDKDKGCGANINQLPTADKKWMSGQQITNTYPWTRMGYTYDWGSTEKGKIIGVAEFVIRPNTCYSGLNFITREEMKTKKNGWPGLQ